jgi:flagellum-specific peptidoglycan hydrolase FlgJ
MKMIIIVIVFIAIFLYVYLTSNPGKFNSIASNLNLPLGWDLLQKTAFDNTKNYIEIMKNKTSNYDWNIKLPIAMSSLEVDYGRACYYYNLFNITTDSNNPEEYFKFPTVADLKFLKYNSYDDSIDNFWHLLKLNRYKNAYNNRHNPEIAIRELIKNGYAGDLQDPTRYLNTLKEVEKML